MRPAASHLVAAFLLAGFSSATLNGADGHAGGIDRHPLAARSQAGGTTLFTVLPPERTGVTTVNRYDDSQMWGAKLREFTYGSVGTGIAIGDFDQDGRPDLFVVNKTGPNVLYRNLGDFRFEDVTARAGVAGPSGAWKQGAAFADVNNDGLLDLYVCRFNAPNLLYLNRGDGTFREAADAAGLDVTNASGMAAFCDYDRDGWLDVYVQTNLLDGVAQPKGQRDLLFHNRGDGTFENVTDAAGIFGETQGHSATWWDYDNDGWPDLYVANDYAVPDQLYHNNGNGTFTYLPGVVLPHIPWFSMGADVGDVNNDGLLDFFVADMATVKRRDDLAGMIELRAAAAGEELFPGVAPQVMQNALFLNTGTGLYQEAARLAGLAATDWTWSPRLEDFDNDGRVDLHVTNGMVRDYLNPDVLIRQESATSLPARDKLIVDAPELRQSHLAFRNLGDLQFENVSHRWGLDETGVSTGSATGDLDGDGDLDLVYANYHGPPTICRNDSPDGHRLVVALRGRASNRFGVGATVRLQSAAGPQVRQLVLARGYDSTSEPILHFGFGADQIINRLTVEWPSGLVQELRDVAADQRITISEPEGAPPRPGPARPAAVVSRGGQFGEVSRPLGLSLRSKESPVDEFEAQPLLPFRHNRLGPALALADLNGDGFDDVWLGGAAGENSQLMLSARGGAYRAVATTSLADELAVADAGLLMFDANGDGLVDFLKTKGGVAAAADSAAYQPHLFLGQPGGRVAPAPDGAIPEFPVSAGTVCAADFNHDNQLDLFIGGRVVPEAYPATPRSGLWRNAGGKFTDVTATLAPGLAASGMVTAALWTDVDGDGWIDLLTAHEWGAIRCWHNEQGRHFEDWTQRLGFDQAGAGWWNSLAAADFNGDGRVDYVAGNLGLNTPYRASAGEPALLYYGEPAPGRPAQLVEATTEDGKLHPLRSRKMLSRFFPRIRQKFSSNAPYAATDLAAILGEGWLESAQRFAATEFRSGVFLSQPDGRFRFSPLPRIVQIAPLYGMAAGDFDGDGHADLYVVQNSYAPIAETGRFDGGLSQYLRGDGRGNFMPVPPAESGLLVPGDAKGLVVSDFDGNGWPDFLVSRNDDITLAYLNRGVEGRNCFGVSLRGPAGNAPAIGALITVQLTDGTSQSSEVYAGSGYLSQSGTTAFFGFLPGNPPREIRVRWPSGKTSTHPWTGPQRVITLSSPAE